MSERVTSSHADAAGETERFATNRVFPEAGPAYVEKTKYQIDRDDQAPQARARLPAWVKTILSVGLLTIVLMVVAMLASQDPERHVHSAVQVVPAIPA